MGIRFNTNTWRAPLQLIDCWLPRQPSTARASAMPAPRLLQRFAKAGWLNSPLSSGAPIATNARSPSQTKHHGRNDRTVTVQRKSAGARSPSSPHSDGRLFLSGRIDQVCAELERLAAIEQRMFQ
ncbi:hypothetical protein [Hydrogenophaga crassostreae]|uniref:hypothetical protein n=1 Tax=Hydrogenophaga crassostreae TaxID=1763535 RepID=UPI000AFD8E70|nr:hypothetical protein [Hydrogenophaga crassostreae]